MPVVVGRADAAVDLRGGEDEAAALAQRHDLVHGHDVVGHARHVAAADSERTPLALLYCECHADLRVPLRERHHVRDPAEHHRRPADDDPETGVPVERVLHPLAVHFKGKGFYNTDYGTQAPQPRARASRRQTARTRPTPSAKEKKADTKSSSSSSSLVVQVEVRVQKSDSSSVLVKKELARAGSAARRRCFSASRDGRPAPPSGSVSAVRA